MDEMHGDCEDPLLPCSGSGGYDFESAVDQVFNVFRLRDTDSIETFDVKYALLVLGIDLPSTELSGLLSGLDPLNVGYVGKSAFFRAVSEKIVGYSYST